MKLTLSTGCIKGHDIKRALDVAAKAGLSGIEILLQHGEVYRDIEKADSYRRDLGLEVSFVHAPFFQPKLSEYLVDPRRVAESILLRSFETAAKIGARGVVVHPFPAFLNVKSMRRLMSALLKEHRPDGMVVAVENLEKRRFGPFYLSPYCLRSGDDLYAFSSENNCNITLDVAHCASHGVAPAHFYKVAHDRIVNIHLSDYEAFQCHYPLGSKTIDFQGLIASLKEHNYDGYICLETDPRYEESIFAGIKKLKEWIAQ